MQNSTTTKTERNSSIELLRIIAMLMIMILHANYVAIGIPGIDRIIHYPTSAFLQVFAENSCIVGVNVFVLISGWFGIKYKRKKLTELFFQCLFFSIIVFAIFIINGNYELNRINILSSLMLYKNAYWFVWSYLVLYITAPIINSFIENNDKSTFKRVLILFLSFQIIIQFFTSCGFFAEGYSPLSFMGLYLLARYFRLHVKKYCKTTCLFIYILCVALNTAMVLLPVVLYGNINDTLMNISWIYNNPLNIIGALSLLLFFSKLNIKSRLINWISISTLTVYLIHSHECTYMMYRGFTKSMFDNLDRTEFIFVMSVFIITIFTVSILLDKIRIFVFNKLYNLLFGNK